MNWLSRVAVILWLASACTSLKSDLHDAAMDQSLGRDATADQSLTLDAKSDVPVDQILDRPADSLTTGNDANDANLATDRPTNVDAAADSVAASPVVITTNGPVPAATVGIAYTSKIEAQGGEPPYKFSLVGVAAGLSWLSIDASTGVLSGTPTQATTAPAAFSVSVYDSRSNTAPESIAMKAYTLTVNSCKEGIQVDCSGTLSGAAACGFGKSTCTNGVAGPCVATTPSTDIARCGSTCSSCDLKTAKSCISGQCKCGAADPCASGVTCCGDGTTAACVNTATAADNCGGCGVKCPAGGYRCEGGACKCGAGGVCPSGQTCCGTGTSASCVGLQQDLNSCGQCGVACDRTRADSCSGGACRCGAGALCAAGQTCCSGTCVDTKTSFTNCGSCGGTCGGGTTTCIAGQCSCGTHQGACGSGTTCCGGGCYNTNTDPNHCGIACGACNQVIPPNADRVCNSGQCDFKCQNNYTQCGTSGCFNMASDSYHCGNCSHSCKGDTCKNNACQVTRLTNSSDAAPYFNSPGVPTDKNLTVTASDGAMYQANDAGKISYADYSADICKLPSGYQPVSEGGADGVAVDSQYVYGLFTDGNQNKPVLIRCRRNAGDTQTPDILFPAAGVSFSGPGYGAGGGIKDTGDALYWGARETQNGPIVVYRLVR